MPKAKATSNKLWAGVAAVDSDADDKYRAEDDLRTLQRAKEIERDKARLRSAKVMAKQKIKDMKDIC